MPSRLKWKANRRVWYTPTPFCFVLPAAKSNIAGWKAHAIYFFKSLSFNQFIFTHTGYYLHCAISGPG
ncbi:hypothetical protein [Mucilaginibacter gotjawali]|uniref:hypothetical protein n=1 Tax=Mucilaginibacter gotjawali TaxID=1550579 RepID=UPI0012FD9503|nr:hypothetical protein [Mucilaginibacter gotjawali]